jgi:sugar phosphate isomerase/epimerase
MKLSCLPVSLFAEIISGKMSMPEWARLQKTCELDGLDMSIHFVKARLQKYLDDLKRILQEFEVTPVMVTSYPDFTHPDGLQRERESHYFAADIAFCAQLGIPYLRVLAGQAHPETGKSEGIRWAIDGIRRAAGVADKLGVKLLYENHSKPGAWDYIDFSQPTDIFLEIMNGIKESGVRLNFDTANTLAYGDDPIRVLSEVVGVLETIHVADIKEKGAFNPVLAGTGASPIKELFSLAKAHGFDGWLCIEEASFTGVEGIKQAVRNTRALWNEAKAPGM